MPKTSAVFGLPIPVLADGRPDAEQVFTEYTTRLETVLTGIIDADMNKLSVPLADSAPVDTLAPGFYQVPNTIVAGALALPDRYPGILASYAMNTGAGTQSFFSLRGGSWTRLKIGGTWKPWVKDGQPTTEALTSSSNLDTLATGFFSVSNRIVATGTKAPDNYPGIVVSYSMDAGAGIQQFFSLRGGVWARTQLGGTWGLWEKAGGASTGGTGQVAQRLHLQQRLLARKGGVIGTNNLGAVALRFDDAPAEFRTRVLPLLEELGLPFSRVTTSKSIGGTVIDPTEFTHMQEYCLRAGGEVWNHGADHLDASGAEGIKANLIGALADLRTAMPRLPIDCFSPPGGSAISYEGHMPSNTPENWATYAGELLTGHHAIVTGYYGDSLYRPLDGVLRDGQRAFSCDGQTYSQVKAIVDNCRGWKMGAVLMWHGNNAGAGGSWASWEDFEATLRYIASEREAGRILVLTVTGLAAASRASTYRDNLITISPNASSEFLQYVNSPATRQGIAGSTRELTATVTGTPGTQVITRIGAAVKTHTIPSSGSMVVRHLATIPLDQTANFAIKVEAPCTGVKCLAV